MCCILLASCHYAPQLLRDSSAHACNWYLSLHTIVFFILLNTFRHLLAFANNLAIMLTDFDPSTLIRDLGWHYITACNNWCESHRLKLNTIKIRVIIFNRKYKICLPRPIRLQGLDFDFSSTVKYLGIRLDSCLNWHEHAFNAAKKYTNIFLRQEK